jgi:hypothetical protein
MVYSEARRRQFLSFGQRTTMLYALERDSDRGSTFAVVELSEGRDVSSGPVPRMEFRVQWPAASLRAQQSRFDNFRYVFNNERPHEGLNNQVPASLYQPSSIRLPRNLPEFTHPKGLLLRRVNNSGDISWHKNRVFISEVFRFEELAFELITPLFYRVFFRDMEIGELNVEELRFRAARRVV